MLSSRVVSFIVSRYPKGTAVLNGGLSATGSSVAAMSTARPPFESGRPGSVKGGLIPAGSAASMACSSSECVCTCVCVVGTHIHKFLINKIDSDHLIVVVTIVTPIKKDYHDNYHCHGHICSREATNNLKVIILFSLLSGAYPQRPRSLPGLVIQTSQLPALTSTG